MGIIKVRTKTPLVARGPGPVFDDDIEEEEKLGRHALTVNLGKDFLPDISVSSYTYPVSLMPNIFGHRRCTRRNPYQLIQYVGLITSDAAITSTSTAYQCIAVHLMIVRPLLKDPHFMKSNFTWFHTFQYQFCGDYE